jgi:hypothetical protein
MKVITLSLLALATALTGGSSGLKVTVNNPHKQARKAVPVVIDLDKWAPGVTVTDASAIAAGTQLPVQFDDLDNDGIADELATVVDVPASGKADIEIKLNEAPSSQVAPLVNAYIKMRDEKKKYPRIVSIAFPGDADTRTMYNSIYGHGAVIEGLYNAIRIYMDNRQSIDVYSKVTPQLELDITGFYTTPEQVKQGYGRDILWAGKSVAAGSFRGYQAGNPVTIDTVEVRGQRVVASGPVRAIIEVTDDGWQYNGRRHNMVQRYTLWGGHRDYQVDVDITGDTAADIYATGIQKLETDNRGFIRPDGLAGSWGSNIPEKKYPELVEQVGLGLWTPAGCRVETRQDDVNYLTLLKPDRKTGLITYHVNIAGDREKDGFKDSDSWFKHLEQWKRELETPCTVTVTAD